MFEKYSKENRKKHIPMSLVFAFSSPAHIIATFFGSGTIRPASGTWGTLAGLIFYMLLQNLIPFGGWVLLTLASFFVGAWASGVTGKDIAVHDHNSIVIDEVFAIWMVLLTVPHSWTWQIGAFLAFRFFDIVKVPPANYIDTHWHNGFGVMADDAVAGFYAIILLQILQWFL